MKNTHCVVWSLLWVAPLIGCAEAPFSVHRSDNDLSSLRPAVAKIQTATAAKETLSGTSRKMVFLALGPERKFGSTEKNAAVETTLLGYDLTEQKERFAVASDVRSRFVVSQGVVMYREGASDLVLRDVTNGSVRARLPLEAGETLAGLSSDEKQLYYVTWKKTGQQSKSQLTALSPSGAVLWSLPAQGSMGAPASRGGLLAVPYRYQNVVLLDAQTGQELSRIRQKDEQIGFVRAGQSGFLYGIGTQGAGFLDEKSVHGEKKAISYVAPKLGENVRVFLHWDGYRPEQTDFSAFDRNRLLWDVESKENKLAFAESQTVLHSYRFLFGMDAQQGTVRWAYAHPRTTLMASEIVGDTVLFVSSDGEIGGLQTVAGKKVLSQRVTPKPGQVVLGASFDAAGLPTQTTELGKTEPLLDVLRGIVFDRDSSFLSVKVFAVQALGKVKDQQAAADLVRVITADGMPTKIAEAAGEALVRRKDDPKETAALVVAALRQTYDHLEDKRPRGIGVLAKVAAALRLPEAVPVLADRLLDPSTPQNALRDVVVALSTIGGKEALVALRKVLFLYRSDPAFGTDPEILRRAGDGVLAIGGETERRLLRYLSMEPHTLPAIATHFQKVLENKAKPAPKTPAKL